MAQNNGKLTQAQSMRELLLVLLGVAAVVGVVCDKTAADAAKRHPLEGLR